MGLMVRSEFVPSCFVAVRITCFTSTEEPGSWCKSSVMRAGIEHVHTTLIPLRLLFTVVVDTIDAPVAVEIGKWTSSRKLPMCSSIRHVCNTFSRAI